MTIEKIIVVIRRGGGQRIQIQPGQIGYIAATPGKFGRSAEMRKGAAL